MPTHATCVQTVSATSVTLLASAQNFLSYTISLLYDCVKREEECEAPNSKRSRLDEATTVITVRKLTLINYQNLPAMKMMKAAV